VSERESAVGALLRAVGVTATHGRAPGAIGIREAERLTGVSRQTISAWLKPVEGDGRKYNAGTLDAVASALGINRRRLGVAAAVDMGLLEPSDGCPSCAELREGLTELLERTGRG
jgi:hypothetical protein